MTDNKNGDIRQFLFEEPGERTKRTIRIATAVSLVLLAAVLGAVIRQFYRTGQLDAKYWRIFIRWTTWRFLARGLAGTLEAAAMAGVMAFAAGFCLMYGRISRFRWLRALCTALIEFTRGVPTLLFIYFFFLVAPQLGIKLAAFWKISIPVAISACGVVAEVLRSGVNAVPRGQREAAMAIGMRDSHAFFKVIFPQVFRYVVPALISELVIVVKDTTFAYVVNFPDLMQNARVLISNYDALLSTYLVVAVIYILINYLLNKASDAAARRMRNTGTAAAPEMQTGAGEGAGV